MFAGNNFARAILFDRSIQRGLGGAKNLFQKGITNAGAKSASDIDKILEQAKAIDVKAGYGGRWTDIAKAFPK